MVRRVAFAVVAIPLALGIVWFGGWPLALLVAVVGALGTRELFDLARQQGVDAARARSASATAALLAPLACWRLRGRSPACRASRSSSAGGPTLGALWLLGAPGLGARAPRADASGRSRRWPSRCSASLYAGALPAFLIAHPPRASSARSPGPGPWLVFFPLVVTWVCDSAAMSGGRAIGGPKLAPTVSPGKTRSGAVGRRARRPAGGAALRAAWSSRGSASTSASWQLLVIAGVLLGASGRWATSPSRSSSARRASRTRATLIPGHGGVLDRFDSLYFVLPVAALLYRALRDSLMSRRRPTRGVAVLGSTGSIGESALAVLGRQRDHFRVVALTAGRNASAC